MIQSLAHGLDRARRSWPPLSRQINDPRDATHLSVLKTVARASWIVNREERSTIHDAYNRRTLRASSASTRRGKKRLTRKIQRASRPRTVSVRLFFNARRMPPATFSAGIPLL